MALRQLKVMSTNMMKFPVVRVPELLYDGQEKPIWIIGPDHNALLNIGLEIIFMTNAF